MRIFKTRAFEKFAKRNQITDHDLIQAITHAELGLINADLGANIIKQRIAKQGQGKSGGYHTIIVYRFKTVAFFVVGFEKNNQSNISKQETNVLKQATKIYLALSENEIEAALFSGALIEIPYFTQ